MGRHTTNQTVFADATGARTRALRIGIRTAAAALVAATVLVLISLLSGVPMPGFTRPVRLPTSHPAAQPANQHTSAAARTPQAVVGLSSSPAVRTTATQAPSTPRPTSPTAVPTSTPAPSPTAPSASAPTTPPGRTHGNKPPTPPGRTRHP